MKIKWRIYTSKISYPLPQHRKAERRNRMILKRKNRIVSGVIIALVLTFLGWVVWANFALEANEYTIKSDKISDSFDGFRIAHISDLHNSRLGSENGKLLEKLTEANPDIIAITGDLIDSRRTNISLALEFTKEAVKIAPCYFVSGNHESRISEYDYLESELEKQGVVVLDNKTVEIEKSGEKLALIGIKDPSFKYEPEFRDIDRFLRNATQQLQDGTFTVILSHRPELFDIYVKNGADLSLCGHLHGGQIRLPFIGGLLSPDPSLFPEYDAGLFTENTTNMIVSRGIGNSAIPLRFNNRPEIIVVTLAKA